MDFPLITIATVTFNAEHTLERTLRSVAQQDYPRIEHIIVDGCSADHTISHVQRYVEQNSHQEVPHTIRLIREPDNGLYDAMNKAIAAATGDYIVFLNAGDKLHEAETISELVRHVDYIRGYANNPAVVYGETDLVDDKGQFIRHRRLSTPRSLDWKSFRNGMLVCHQSFYVRTDFAKGIPYNQKYRFSADFDWCIRIMKLAQRKRIPILNTGMILTDYLAEGLTTRNHRKSLGERFEIMSQYYGTPGTILFHLWFLLRSVLRR